MAGEPIPVARVAQAADHLHAPDGTGGPDRAPPSAGMLAGMSAQAAPAPHRAVDVAVIGGGIIGCAAAAILADRGAPGRCSSSAPRSAAGASGRNLGAIQHPFDAVLAAAVPRQPRRATAPSPIAATGSRSGTPRPGCCSSTATRTPPRARSRASAAPIPELRRDVRSTPTRSSRLEPSLRRGPAGVLLATGYPIPPAVRHRGVGRPRRAVAAPRSSSAPARARRSSPAAPWGCSSTTARGRRRRGARRGRAVDAAARRSRRAPGGRSAPPMASPSSCVSADAAPTPHRRGGRGRRHQPTRRPPPRARPQRRRRRAALAVQHRDGRRHRARWARRSSPPSRTRRPSSRCSSVAPPRSCRRSPRPRSSGAACALGHSPSTAARSSAPCRAWMASTSAPGTAHGASAPGPARPPSRCAHCSTASHRHPNWRRRARSDADRTLCIMHSAPYRVQSARMGVGAEAASIGFLHNPDPFTDRRSPVSMPESTPEIPPGCWRAPRSSCS